MQARRINIGSIRREQIVEAAVAIINEQGLQNLSLSEIEKKAGMSRGQLTYYFPTKEDILLAVFDRLVLLIHQRVGQPSGKDVDRESGWEWMRHLLETLIAGPPVSPEFGCLQYTFLSQIGHRDDFRRRLATLYEQWRTNMAMGFTVDMERRDAVRRVSPRALATLVQAILHGLSMQKAADPEAFDREEVIELCLDVVGTFLWQESRGREKRKPRARKKPPAVAIARGRRLLKPSADKGVNGERTHE